MKNNSFKAVFWDNDGVLVDTEHLYYQANRDVLEEIGIELSVEFYQEMSLKRGGTVLHLAKEKGGCDDAFVEKLQQRRNERYSEILEESHDRLLIPGVPKILRRLKGRLKMGIVTSCRGIHFDIIHKHTKILDNFDFIIRNEDYERSKPSPDPYLKALEKSALAPSECLAVEDTERGLCSARSAGLECVVIPRGISVEGDFSSAFRVLENVSMLEEILIP